MSACESLPYALGHDAKILSALPYVSETGALALSIANAWRPREVFVLLTAYVDESGVGGEEHCTVAAFVGRLGRWHAFDKDWKRLLDRSPNSPAYAHLVEMERREPPFQNWNTPDISTFYRKGVKLVQRYSDFGISVTVSQEDYARYRAGCPPKTSPDSAYGLCVRMVIDFIVSFYRDDGERNRERVNFIFDRRQKYRESEQIFHEMKTCYDDCRRILGTYSSGALEDHYGLQIADYFVARARRLEKSPAIGEARIAREGDAQKRARVRPAPLFHVGLNDGLWDVFFAEKGLTRSRMRWAKSRALKQG